jgi:hypothetical protein
VVRNGFSAGDGTARVRIGIIGNQENDCNSPDSWVGVGGQNSPCFGGSVPTSGNTAGCTGDNGDRHNPAFAWVFVR